MKISFLALALNFTTISLVYSVDPNRELLKAVRNANLDEVLKALQNGAHVNACTDDLETPLHLATYDEHAPTRIETVYNTVYPGVYQEHLNGKPKITKILLNAGADSNAQNIYGKTPFNLALLNGSMQVARLIKNYSEILQQIYSKPTKKLLTQAINLGFFSLVKLLLKVGIKPDLHDLALAKQKYMQSSDNFDKDTYVTIGRMLLQHLRLNGLVQALKHNHTTCTKLKNLYHKTTHLFWPIESTTAEHAHGPISKSGLGLPENVAHIIASFMH